MALESNFQRRLKQELKQRFPGCYVLKNDPTDIQGIPDLSILYKDKWAMLEVKRDKAAMVKSQKSNKNQAFRIKELNEMSYAAYIYPENKEEIINDLARAFGLEG